MRRISTNTNLTAFSRGGEKRMMTELLPLYAERGWINFDLNFCEMMNPSSPLNDERSAAYIEELLELKKILGIKYTQAHAPYPVSSEPSEESTEAILRSMDYAERLGIPQIVIHPIKGSIGENIEYFESILSRHSGNIMIAVENMEGKDEIGDADSLISICRALSGRLTICLDTGHLNIRGYSIPDFIKRTSGYLSATHIADNDGKSDQHLLPGFGTIAWEDVMDAFNDYYEGSLNFECMFFSRNLPSSCSPEVIDLSLSVMSWLLQI